MEGTVKSHISNNTYTTDLEKLEEDDMDETSELYMIPVSGHRIMVAPGKSIMKDGIAYCYVYVIKKDKVLCKLGVYEKKTETMPLFFDLSTFPEGSFCLFEEYEKNPSRLLEFEMTEPDAKTKTQSLQNVFDYLIDEFTKIPNKRERLKSAYKSLFSTYDTKKTVEKYKKIKPILKIISDAGKEDEPTDAFIRTLKTNAQDKPVFVMTLLALQRIFFIDFTFVAEYEMMDERDEYIKMKEDWPISNATKELEVDVNTFSILEPTVIVKNENNVVGEEADPDDLEADKPEDEDEADKPEDEPEAEDEPEQEAEPQAEAETQSEDEPQAEAEQEPKPFVGPLSVKSKTKPATISETEPFSMSDTQNVKVNKPPKSESGKRSSAPKESKAPSVPKASAPKESKPPSVPKVSAPKESKASSKAVYVPDEPLPAVGMYESPLSKASIQNIVARTKAHKSTSKLISDYKAGIMPSSQEDEKRLRSALVEMAASSLMKGKKKADTASILAEAVSKVKKNSSKEASLSTTLSKKKESANKPEPEPEPAPTVTLKQNRSIPAVKVKVRSRPDKVV